VKTLKGVARAAATAGCLALCAPAFAQFGTAAKPRQQQPGAAVGTNYFVNFYPFARFTGTASGASAFFDGVLVSADASFWNSRSDSGFRLGGWYWRWDGNYLYGIDGKYFFPRSDIGVQAGTVGTSGANNDFDAFLLYNLSSHRFYPTSPTPWDLTFGLGIYNYGGGGGGTQFSGFVQGSFHLYRNWSLEASYWHIRSPAGFQDRIALGVGYRF
jgi:hypothetical protein